MSRSTDLNKISEEVNFSFTWSVWQVWQFCSQLEVVALRSHFASPLHGKNSKLERSGLSRQDEKLGYAENPIDLIRYSGSSSQQQRRPGFVAKQTKLAKQDKTNFLNL